MLRLFNKVLHLGPGELARLMPFFVLYSLLFAGMTLADGVSLALFVHRVGAEVLPKFYALTAFVSLFLIYLYLQSSQRWSHQTLFQFILYSTIAQFLLAYAALSMAFEGTFWYGLLFVAREVSYTLVLMHFGTYLQSYFTRDELNRILPLVYAGGRLGGIAGAALLSYLSPLVGLVNLILVVMASFLLSSALIALCQRIRVGVDEAESSEATGEQGGTKLTELIRFVTSTPLMFWFSMTGLLFMICRWIVNYQYSSYLEMHFSSEVELASFLGNYSQVALTFSMIFQLCLVSRLIKWIGLKGTHLLYNLLLFSSLALNISEMTLVMAVYARFVETDLRFILRNPVNQLITNKFSKATRVKARAITLGAVNPFATLISSALLTSFPTSAYGIGLIGISVGIVYLGVSFPLYRSFSETLSLPRSWTARRWQFRRSPPN